MTLPPMADLTRAEAQVASHAVRRANRTPSAAAAAVAAGGPASAEGKLSLTSARGELPRIKGGPSPLAPAAAIS